jgi:small-conductance mechanosensitive channel
MDRNIIIENDDEEVPLNDTEFWDINESPNDVSNNPDQALNSERRRTSQSRSRANSTSSFAPPPYMDPEEVIHQQVYQRTKDSPLYDPYVNAKQVGNSVIPTVSSPISSNATLKRAPRSNTAVALDPSQAPDTTLSTKDVVNSRKLSLLDPNDPLRESKEKAVKQTVGKVDDKFKWLDEDLEERDAIIWDHHETKCTRYWSWFNNLPRLYRMLTGAAVGMIILLIPGIIDIIFFVQNNNAYWADYQPTTDQFGNPQWFIGGKVLFVWSLWAAISWFIAWLVWYLIPLIPFVLTRIVLACMGVQDATTTQSVVEQVELLGIYVLVSLWFFISAVMFLGMMSPLTAGIDLIVFSALRNGFLVSIIWLLVRLGMTRFAKNYQRMIFKARLEKNRWEIFVLEHLYKAVPSATLDLEGDLVLVGVSQGKEKDEAWIQTEQNSGAGVLYGGKDGATEVRAYGTVSFPHDVDPRARLEYDQEQKAASAQPVDLEAGIAGLEGLDEVPPPSAPSPVAPPQKDSDVFHKFAMDALNVAITGGVAAVDLPLGVPLSTLREAKLLARDLFVTFVAKSNELKEQLAQPVSPPMEMTPIASPVPHNEPGKEYIIQESFLPYFDDPRLAQQAFDTFDLNLDKQVTRDEIKDKVVEIYNDRLTLEKSMSDTLQALSRLEGFVNSILWFITALFIAGLFINIGEWLATFSAFWAGLAFAFQPTIKAVVESILFVFVNHPFDVGDRVAIDKQEYFVKELGIMGTVLTHTDGRVMYASNTVLANKYIFNIRRSGPMDETFTVQVPLDTPNSVLVELERRTNEMLDKRFAKDFYGGTNVWVKGMDYDKGTMMLSLSANSKTNWQSGSQRWVRNTRFLRGFRRIMKELQIKPGALEVIHVAGVSDYYKKAIELGRMMPITVANELTRGRSALALASGS